MKFHFTYFTCVLSSVFNTPEAMMSNIIAESELDLKGTMILVGKLGRIEHGLPSDCRF